MTSLIWDDRRKVAHVTTQLLTGEFATGTAPDAPAKSPPLPSESPLFNLLFISRLLSSDGNVARVLRIWEP